MNITNIASIITVVFGALLSILTFIEKSQMIKWNPISNLFHNKELEKRLDTIDEKITNVEEKITKVDKKVDKTDISTIRSRISSTATLIQNGGNMTYDQYKCIFEDIDTWRKYHERYPDLNGIINASIEIIEEEFKKERF